MDQSLAGNVLSFLHFLELLLTVCLADELGGDRVREDQHPGWQEELTTRNQQEERERNELDDIGLNLAESSRLLVRGLGVAPRCVLVLR